MCTGGRGQILAPWPNRLEDGTYEFAGRVGVAAHVAFDLNECNPLGVVGSPDLKVFQVRARGTLSIHPVDPKTELAQETRDDGY